MSQTNDIKPSDFPLLSPEQYSDELCGCGSGLPKSKERRHRNTSYTHEESNWHPPCCDECFSEDWNGYAEQWADYYAGLM